jgi:hypothetical protein
MIIEKIVAHIRIIRQDTLNKRPLSHLPPCNSKPKLLCCFIISVEINFSAMIVMLDGNRVTVTLVCINGDIVQIDKRLSVDHGKGLSLKMAPNEAVGTRLERLRSLRF